MSRTVDERVVSMQFDNKNFESNVHTSLSTLDKLKKSLRLEGASKGLENVSSAAKKVDMAGLGSGIESVTTKFSALQVMGVTALANITNSAVNAGKRLVSALTIDPVKDGFAEYETQMNAVQTILANTQKEGTNVKVVNAALDDLNHYADKTIYNFTEMTRNIGTFTAAGVKLDTSVSSIKGIANLAAVSGSSSQQASTAMYQLSQAIAAGTVKLMDWNSVVNAGMGGQVFQDALVRTSEHLQTGAKGAIAAEGSFRESLSTGWLTTEVLTQTLDQFATAADTQEEYEAAVKKFVDQGYSQEEAKQMADMAKTAGEAATKVKTFSQLIDTLKEALGSGWTESWRMIIGDFEEAKELWTSVSDVLSDAINKSSDARNKIIKEWADAGGRNDLIQSFKNVFEGIGSIVKPVKEAFRDIFPPMTSKRLIDFTKNLKDLTAKIKISDSTAAKLKSTFSGLFSVASMLGKILGGVGKAFGKLITSEGVKALANLLLSATAAIGDFLTALNKGFDSNGFTGVLTTIVSGISNVLKTASDGISKFGNTLPNVGNGIIKVVSKIWESIKTVFGWISDNFSASDLFAGLAGGGIFVAAKKIADLFDTIKDKFEGFFGGGKDDGLKGVAEQFGDILDSVHDSLKSFTTGIKATTILTIAAAIGILSASLKTIAGLKGTDIAKSLSAIAAMFVMLNVAFKSINKTLDKYKTKELIKAGASILLIAFAIKTLASAMVKLSSLSLKQIAKGLIAMGGGLTELCLGLKAINKVKVKMSTSIAMLALAESCKILGDALQKFGLMSWSEITRGLVGMGGALGEFVIALKALDKVGGMKSIFSGAGLLIAVQSLSKMADGLKKFGSMSWDEIKHGLVGMGGALAEVGTTVGVLGKLVGFKSIIGSSSILIVVQGLDDLADALQKFASMSWDEIKHGLVGMGGALGEVATAAGVLGKLAGFKSIIGSGSIVLLIQGLNDLADALQKFGWMSWDEIKRGLVGMGGALGEVAVVSGTLGKLAGFKSIIGSGSIVLLIQGLNDLADALQKFGWMSWDEIKRGLVGMGGALTELAVVSGLLGSLAGLPALLGSGSLLLAIQGLGDLADAFKKFGEMSWEEIGRGLAAMGGALSEVALGSIANTLSGLGALSIKEVAEPLGTLADSVKKWSDVTVPDGLGVKLTSLAMGVASFTLDGLGAVSIATVAEPLGTLADSVKKWAGVTVPEGIDGQLSSLASGVRSFTLDGLGAVSIATVAEPLGTLADSTSKWSNVTVPDGLESGLKQISNGIKSFSWAFLGGMSLSTIIGPLGKLPDSIKKWNGVEVPNDLEDGLKRLANGVKAFSWAFLGGMSLSTIVGPIGKLAGSIKKWNGVTVPDGLENGLKSIANGVKAFSLAFIGGLSLDTVVGPIGKLAGSIKKWNGVSVPDGLESGLKSIASGIKSFSLAFIGGWSLGSVTEPIGKLAGSIKKWNGVTVPNDIGTQLSNLASGVKAFTGIGDISSTVSSISKISYAMSTLSGVSFGMISSGLSVVAKSFSSFASSTSSLSNVGTTIANNIINPIRNAGPQISSAASIMMNSLSTAITSRTSMIVSSFNTMMNSVVASVSSRQAAFNAAGAAIINGIRAGISSNSSTITSVMVLVISNAAASVSSSQSKFINAGKNLATGIASGIRSGAPTVKTAVTTAMTSCVTSINSSRSKFTNAGKNLMSSMASGIRTGSSTNKSAITTILNTLVSTIRGKRDSFKSAGEHVIKGFAEGISSGSSSAESKASTVANSAKSKLRDKYDSFYSAGSYLVDGFAAGISENSYKAEAKATAMAKAAAKAAKKALDINSPSKVFRRIAYSIPEGFAQGIDRMSWMSDKSAEEMAESTLKSTTNALSIISDAIQNDVDAEPTIRPVLDMSSAQTSDLQLTASVTTLFNKPITSLSQLITDAQAEINASNHEVVTAINGLREDLATIYSGDDSEIALYVDSKKLASSLAKPMNRQLNILSKKGAY